MLQNDRKIKISSAGSRRAARWPAQELWISELYDRLRVPARGTETMAEYLSMKKARQDELKDVGGFVGGVLRGGVRKAGAIEGRDVITLDMDHVPAEGTANVLARLDGLGCGYAVYSTRKHSPAAPRLRAIVPTDRTLTPDEYEPAARKLAQLIDPTLALFDRTTFEAVRLMYFPSCCADSEYIFQYADKPLLSADGMLALYGNWGDVSQWPQCPGAAGRTPGKTAGKQEAPTAKHGVIGAFCRTYDVYAAMDKFIPGVYVPTDIPERYTYTGGSTTGGAIIYEGGQFLYSHHATDPAGGQLCNSFDLVRLHLFADQDDDAAPGTPVNKLPSYTAMRHLAVADESVTALLDSERYAEAAAAFATPAGESPEEAANWMRGLKRHPNTGRYDNTVDNVLLILNNDPRLRDRIALDEFASRAVARGPFPWDSREGRRIWGDNDDAGIRWYIERAYDITGKEKVMDALSLCGRAHASDPVREYLENLVWDGTPRLETLYVDYLGADDNIYTRAVTRKAFCAAVARALMPGTKFDCMTVLTGAQGIGKSTLLRKMGLRWFSDSLKTFEGKEACELVQGVWIIEVGELEAMNRSEVGRVKQFLSQNEDIFRVPYGRRTDIYPRRCVFFGTSNNSEYLRDGTGSRRFWPVDVGIHHPTKSIWADLGNEVDQLWAEAVLIWRLGEPLFISDEAAERAKEVQEGHRERGAREGLIHDFVERPVPRDWMKWDLARRRMFWAGGMKGDAAADLVARSRVCPLEVWCEALDGDPKNIKYQDAREINDVIARIDGWKRVDKAMRFGPYGVQKGLVREAAEDTEE